METDPVILQTAASLYGVSISELQPLRGGHVSHVYGFARGDKKYILRLTPPNDEITVHSQRSILDWLSYLSQFGAFVPSPLASQNGNLIETLSTQNGEWLAVAFTQAEGILSEEIPLEQWDADQFEWLGKSIGRMHAIARTYRPTSAGGFQAWEDAGNLFSHRLKEEHWLADRQADLLRQIQSLPKTNDHGLIHCDLHFGNFFVDIPHQVVTIIDFDDSAYGWFIMDIAVLLFDVLVLYGNPDKDAFGNQFLRFFLTGYLSEHSLSVSSLQALPDFLKLLEINVYDMVAKYYPDAEDEWIGKFVPGRKERLEANLSYVNLDMESLENLFPH